MSLVTWTYWSLDIPDGPDTGPIQRQPSQIATPGELFPKCGPGKGNIRITWELIKNANSWAPPHTDSETLGPSNLCFNKPSRGFWCLLNSETHSSRDSLGKQKQNKTPQTSWNIWERKSKSFTRPLHFSNPKDWDLRLKTTRLGSNQGTPINAPIAVPFSFQNAILPCLTVFPLKSHGFFLFPHIPCYVHALWECEKVNCGDCYKWKNWKRKKKSFC